MKFQAAIEEVVTLASRTGKFFCGYEAWVTFLERKIEEPRVKRELYGYPIGSKGMLMLYVF